MFASFDIKFTRLGFENACLIARQASRCQQAFSKPCLVNLISKDTHLVFYMYWQPKLERFLLTSRMLGITEYWQPKLDRFLLTSRMFGITEYWHHRMNFSKLKLGSILQTSVNTSDISVLPTIPPEMGLPLKRQS